jgi:triacylglycerol lipase
MPKNFAMDDRLLKPPIRRAAYSDRTAWLMAVMSSLAYVRFEQPAALGELAAQLSKEANERKILAKLTSLLAAENRDRLKAELISDLKDIGFDLVNTYDISIPLVVDTQAFLAKLTKDGRDPILILAFRGTEVRKAADIRSDVAANPMEIGPKGKGHKVHTGFYEAFDAVEKLVRQDLDAPELKGIPLYITGHSLGGALAIVATYRISSDSVGACYTFGGPRVGNLPFGQYIRTPVYRIVNAADLVPRLPPSYFIEGLTLLVRWLPVIPYHRQIADFLERFRHYRHYGDLRYLTAATRVAPDTKGNPPAYDNLHLLANPAQISRWVWLCQRVIANGFSVAIKDHSIDTYVEKLAYWGIERSRSRS